MWRNENCFILRKLACSWKTKKKQQQKKNNLHKRRQGGIFQFLYEHSSPPFYKLHMKEYYKNMSLKLQSIHASEKKQSSQAIVGQLYQVHTKTQGKSLKMGRGDERAK